MLKLDHLILAMADEEGWNAIDAATGYEGSASYRRHNPLNLRASRMAIGAESGFCVFRSDMDGFAAAKWDIMSKAQGQTSTGLTGESTLADLIKVWAPASDDNDPVGYLQHVLQRTGFPATMRLKELLTA